MSGDLLVTFEILVVVVAPLLVLYTRGKWPVRDTISPLKSISLGGTEGIVTATFTIKTVGQNDAELFTRVAPGVFDHEPKPDLTSEFLNDPRHHLVVALHGEQIVGFVSAVHYVHPDKPTELFINEVGVTPEHRHQGLGRQLLAEMLTLARRLGCRNAWVLTDRSNAPAMHLYQALGGKESPAPQVMFEFVT